MTELHALQRRLLAAALALPFAAASIPGCNSQEAGPPSADESAPTADPTATPTEVQDPTQNTERPPGPNDSLGGDDGISVASADVPTTTAGDEPTPVTGVLGAPPSTPPIGMNMPSCPTGEVFLAASMAAEHAAPDATMNDGCPSALDPSNVPDVPGAPFGGPNAYFTLEHPADAEEGFCYYSWVIPCPGGRPMLVDGQPLLADRIDGDDWTTSARPQADANDAPLELTADQAEWLAARWLDDAFTEHSSVASFARFTLELMALGAPPEFIAGSQRAGADEVAHAVDCFSLAARYAGRPMAPGPLPIAPPRAASLAQLAADTLAEGCLGETVAVVAVQTALRDCEDADARRALARILEDETRHAELAWSIVAWAARTGGADVHDALRRTASTIEAELTQSADARPFELPAGWTEDDARRFGRLGPQGLADARVQAWTHVIAPILGELLSAS